MAETRADLKAKLAVEVGGVVFTTIRKFFPEDKGDRHPCCPADVSNPRARIVVNTVLPVQNRRMKAISPLKSYCQMLCIAVLSSAASLPVSFSFTPLMNLTSVITSAR